MFDEKYETVGCGGIAGCALLGHHSDTMPLLLAAMTPVVQLGVAALPGAWVLP